MPEGLSADEVGKEITEHAKETGEEHPDAPWERRVSIVEAVLLAIVALTAAWSGYAAARSGAASPG